MIHPEPMSKVFLVGPKSQMPTVIDELYSLKLLHVFQHVKSSSMDLADPLPSNKLVSRYLVHVGTVQSRLGVGEEQDSSTKLGKLNFTLQEVQEKLDKLLPEIDAIIKRKDHYVRAKETFSERKHYTIAESIPLDYGGEYDYEDKTCFVGIIQSIVSEKLAKQFEDVEVFTADVGGHHGVIIYVREEDVTPVRAFLKSKDFIPFDAKVLRLTLPALRGKVANEPGQRGEILDNITGEIEEIEKEKDSFVSQHGVFFKEAHAWLSEESKKAELPLQFGATEKTFFVRGWVPTKEEGRFRKSLEKVTEGKVYLEFEKVTPHGTAPVKQELPAIMRPFKHFLDMYARPVYGEVNPTFFMFLVFPVFFGFMLGDIGYGLVVLVLSILINKMTKGKPLIGMIPPVVLAYSALVTIFFGLVYAEFFGAEIGLYHPLFARVELAFVGHSGERALLHIVDGTNVVVETVKAGALLSISLAIAFVHVSFGYVVGFYNVWRMHGVWHAIKEKLGWLMLMPIMVSLFISLKILTGPIADTATALLPGQSVISGLAGLGVLLIVKGEGMMGIIELPGLLSNLLSYARLMAVGLASVMLAIVANQLAIQSFAGGPIGWVMGVFILLIFHVINILLGILSPFLHSLRLHYVEFFTKFYVGGGKEYSPFGVEG